MKIALLHDANAEGGRPDEADALVQLAAVSDALTALGHTTLRLPLGLDLLAAAAGLRDARPQLVFNLVESVAGEGRLIHLAPALLDCLRLPYTGASTEAMFLSSHKLWTKRLLTAAHIPTPPWIDASGIASEDAKFPGRYIVKSVWEDASIGLDDDSVLEATSAAALQAEIARRAGDLGGTAFAEAFIEGREFNLALLQTPDCVRVLPIAEMCFADYPVGKPQLVGYKAKWDESSFEYSHTVRRFEFPSDDTPLLAQLSRLALATWQCLGLRGYARVDFRVDDRGRPWVLEANANPCLSPDAGYLAAAQRERLELEAVVEHIVQAALERGA